MFSSDLGYEDESAISGKFVVLDASAPVPLMPKMNSVNTYYSRLPSVRFLWKGNDYAASYLLEVADNPVFSRFTNSPSLTISEFDVGTWYWRVTPRYLIGDDIVPSASEISFFHIEKTAKIEEPISITPQMYADTANGKKLTFSWKSMSEAKKYTVKIPENKDMSNPIVEATVSISNFQLEHASKDLPNGEYYWTISGVDVDGRVLSTSQASKFETVDSNVELRSIFPPDGYTITDTLCRDTKFTWKTNLNIEQHFQVSSNKDFSDIVLYEVSITSDIDGIVLDVGEWYWR